MNGRYSLAFSSQPVAQTSSYLDASRASRSPATSGMQWATPSIQWKRPGSSDAFGENPNRLRTPSTSTKRIGLSRPLVSIAPLEPGGSVSAALLGLL
jgi:hypothetical protein